MKQSKLLTTTILFLLILFRSIESDASEPNPELMQGILNHYLNIQEKLASDTAVGVEGEAQGILRKISSALTKPCKPEKVSCSTVQKTSMAASKLKGEDIKNLRQTFIEFSQTLLEYRNQLKPNWPNISVFQCSMANNNQGAPWLQRGSALKNPYFGKSMETCGTAL